ncbi:MAG: hypothetical protein DWH91_10270 [Planctomycetota bacterium]|nr:MAG: hypothetical protein DWH91_10270 [Planctomycetota bacterium]
MARVLAANSLSESLVLRLTNWCLRSVVTALVLTGQLLPSGAVQVEATQIPTPQPVTLSGEPTVGDASPEPEAVVVPVSSPVEIQIIPAVAPLDLPVAGQQGEMRIRPAKRPVPHPTNQPKLLAVVPPSVAARQNSTAVNVQVSQVVATSFQPWGVHPIFAEPSLWRGPTSTYLFDRPLPYWQLRSDFHHLRPMISRLRSRMR